MKKIHRFWRTLRKRSRESRLEKADAFWELELNVTFSTSKWRFGKWPTIVTSPEFYICFQRSKKDVFKIGEYFLAYICPIILLQVFDFTRPSTSLSHKRLVHSNFTCCNFLSFEEIVVKKNDIQEKLGRKRQGRSLSTQMKSTSARMKTKLISVTWMRFVTWVQLLKWLL